MARDKPRKSIRKKTVKKRKKRDKLKIDTSKIFILLVILMILIYGVQIFILSGIRAKINEMKAEVEEESRPAELQLTKIVFSDCTDCYDIDSVIEQLKQQSVKINSEQTFTYGSSEAEDLISKYDVQVLPTLIIEGETDKSNVNTYLSGLGNNIDDAIVFTQQVPPYFDVERGRVVGRVRSTLIEDSTCGSCSDISVFLQGFEQSGVKIIEQKTLEYTSDEAQQLIQKYNIDKIPSLILSEDADVYPNLVQVWPQLGTIENDGSFVMKTINPPYKDLEKDEIVGAVSVVYLTDDSCGQCYDVISHKEILETRFGVFLDDEKTIDISTDEGKELLNKYAITKVPTIILSPDLSVYDNLVAVWTDPRVGVGTVEDDGYFVFRSVDGMRIGGREVTYKDLSTGELVGGTTQ